jgi:hypothetical protein
LLKSLTTYVSEFRIIFVWIVLKSNCKTIKVTSTEDWVGQFYSKWVLSLCKFMSMDTEYKQSAFLTQTTNI